MKLCLIYISTDDYQEAEKIGQILVQERLVACVNIVDKMKSFYWWQKKIDNDQEAILLAKTRQSKVKKIY